MIMTGGAAIYKHTAIEEKSMEGGSSQASSYVVTVEPVATDVKGSAMVSTRLPIWRCHFTKAGKIPLTLM